MKVSRNTMLRRYLYVSLFIFIFSFSLVSSLKDESGTSINFNYPNVITLNDSTFNVNNSLYWQGHTGTDGSWLTGVVKNGTLTPNHIPYVSSNNLLNDTLLNYSEGFIRAYGAASGFSTLGKKNYNLLYNGMNYWSTYEDIIMSYTQGWIMYITDEDNTTLTLQSDDEYNFKILNNVNITKNISAQNFISTSDRYCNSTNCYSLSNLLNDTTGSGGMDYTNVALTNKTNIFNFSQYINGILNVQNGVGDSYLCQGTPEINCGDLNEAQCNQFPDTDPLYLCYWDTDTCYEDSGIYDCSVLNETQCGIITGCSWDLAPVTGSINTPNLNTSTISIWSLNTTRIPFVNDDNTLTDTSELTWSTSDGLHLSGNKYYWIEYALGGGNGAGFVGSAGGTTSFQFGMNAEGWYGGSRGYLNGTQIYIWNGHDYQGGTSAYYWGFNDRGDSFFGPTSSTYSVKISRPNNVTAPKMDIRGANGQTAPIISWGSYGYTGNFFNMTKDGNFEIANNVSVGKLLKLQPTTLPTCSTNHTNTFGANTTGTYGCNSTDWVRLF